VLVGDVGATNLRLRLRKLFLNDRKQNVTIKSKKVDIRSVNSLDEAVKGFLKVILKHYHFYSLGF
jgi:glucokinase